MKKEGEADFKEYCLLLMDNLCRHAKLAFFHLLRAKRQCVDLAA